MGLFKEYSNLHRAVEDIVHRRGIEYYDECTKDEQYAICKAIIRDDPYSDRFLDRDDKVAGWHQISSLFTNWDVMTIQSLLRTVKQAVESNSRALIDQMFEKVVHDKRDDDCDRAVILRFEDREMMSAFPIKF